MVRTTLRAVTFIALLAIGVATHVTAATIDVVLSPDGLGGTVLTINGSGEDHNGSVNGGGQQIQWANLFGGDPFSSGIGGTAFALATPLSFAGSVNLNAVLLEHAGAEGAVLQDDFWLLLSDLFDLDDPFNISGASALIGLDFDVLNPGSYTRENPLAILNLTITAIPLPAAWGLVWLPLIVVFGRTKTTTNS